MIQSCRIYCLNQDKIVKFTAENKTFEERKINKELGFEIDSLRKMNRMVQKMIQICKKSILELKMQETNIFLIQSSAYLTALRNCTHRYLIYKLLNLLQSLVNGFAYNFKCNFGLQLYNHHKQLVHQTLRNIYSQIGRIDPNIKLTNISTAHQVSLIIQNAITQKNNPVIQLDRYVGRSIQNSLAEIIDTLFSAQRLKCIFNSKLYSGLQNIKQIQKTLICDIKKRMTQNFQIDGLEYCYHLVGSLNPTEKVDDIVAEEQIQLMLQTPTEPTQILAQEDIRNQMIECYQSLLIKTKRYRYDPSTIDRMQDMYIIIFKKLQDQCQYKCPQQIVVRDIVRQMQQYGDDIAANKQLLLKHIEWIVKIQDQISKFAIEKYATVGFILAVIRLAALLLKQQKYHQQQLQNNLLKVLSRLVPRQIDIDNIKWIVAFTHKLVDIAIKISKIQLEDQLLALFDVPTKVIEKSQAILESLLERLIQLNCPELLPQIQALLLLLFDNNNCIGKQLSQVAETQKQLKLASIQADIKGMFMMHLEMQESMDKENQIFVPAQVFGQAFQAKYEQKTEEFSRIAQKLLKRTEKQVSGKRIILVSYDKSQPFHYSYVLNKQFLSFKPTNTLNIILKNMLKLNKTKSELHKLQIIINSLKPLLYNYPLLIPYVMLRPITQAQEANQKFVDYIVTFLNFAFSKSISDFLYFVCLQHRSILKLKGRDTFFSHLLCQRIIMQILKAGVNRFNILIIQQLVEIKQFAYLSKMKVSKHDKRCLVDMVVQFKNNQTNQQQQPASYDVFKILASIFKQVEFEGNCKAIIQTQANKFTFQDSCNEQEKMLRDLDYLKQKTQKTYVQEMQNFSVFAENFIRIRSEQSGQLFVEDLYEEIDMDNETVQKLVEIPLFSDQDISQQQERALKAIIHSYQSGHEEQKQKKKKKTINQKPAQKTLQNSRYAQPDFRTQPETQIAARLQRILDTLQPLQAGRPIDTSSFQDVIISINEKLILMGKEPFDEGYISSKMRSEGIDWLLDKHSEVDFDYNKFKLSPAQFDEYLLANTMKLQRLKSRRKQELLLAEEIMFTSNISRNFSTDNLSYMIDTIDENYQHLASPQTNRQQPPSLKHNPNNGQTAHIKVAERYLSQIKFPVEITIEDILKEFEEEAECVRGIQRLIEGAKSNEQVLATDLTFTYLEKRLVSRAKYSLLDDKQDKEAIGKSVELNCTKELVEMELHSEEDRQKLPTATRVVKVTDIHQLKPGGVDIRVTFDNMHEFLSLTKQKIKELVLGSVKKQFEAFREGFSQVIRPTMLRLFSPEELKLLVQGINDISIADLKAHTKNNGVGQATAQHLWNALEELSNDDRALFLWNWTGVDKMPAEGAKAMKLGIGEAAGKFIVAHTCFRNIQIPKCETKQDMKTALSIVINNVKTGQAIIED